MKTTTKFFKLLVIDTGTLKNFKGRDVWDAYRKACNEYERIRTPYSAKSSPKKIKKEGNKRIRHDKSENPKKKYNSSAYISRHKGIVYFD